MLISCHLLISCLSALGPGDDWIRLFDGETLAGWVTEGGRYDGQALWSVEEGALTGREGPGSAGGLIYTAREYEDLELELDCWITYPFDSGIFLRMVPPGRAASEGGGRGPQVTLDHRPSGEIGGLYADGYLLHNARGAERWRRDEWNRLRVRCVGNPPRVVVWLNGELLTDYQIPAHPGDFAPRGRIGLQVHGARGEPETSVVRFRNLRLRELAPGEGAFFREGEAGRLSLTPAGRDAGWRSLFNGADLSGWKPAGSGTGYAVQDGELAFLVEGDSPYLASEADFGDFSLRLDFKIARMANSGVFLRAARDGSNPAYSGCEVQILDDFNWEAVTGSQLLPYQHTGGLYGSVAPGVPDALRPLGQWNTYEIHFLGPRLQTVLNGHVLYDVDTLEVPGDPPFAERAERGFIGLQRHAPDGVQGSAYAWFRNLFVRKD